MVDACPLPGSIPGWDETLSVKWSNVRSWCKPIIQECVEKHNLELELVAAIVMQESGGNPNAVNPSGATGLMQVMRDTVMKFRPSVSELLDPETNIRTGCNILRGYIDNYGSIKDGLWAYGGTAGSYADYADIVLRVYDTIAAAP